MSVTLQRIGTTIRTFEIGDFDQVMRLESSFPSPQSEEWMMGHLRDDSNEMLVLERGSRILGYCLYEEKKHSLRIIRFGVSVPHCGLGRMLMQNVQRRCITHGHNRVDVAVDERNVPVQLFLSRVGFTAIGIDDGSISFRYLRGEGC